MASVMEIGESDGINTNTNTNTITSISPAPPKKRSGSSLLRAALFIVRGRTTKKAPIRTTEIFDSNALNLVDGMRPFHLQQPSPPESPSRLLPPPPPVGLEFYDVPVPPPAMGSDADDSMSRYASAEDLCRLDSSGDDGDKRDGDAPNAIDVKAEEFIAMFYEQMKKQRMESLDSMEEIAGAA